MNKNQPKKSQLKKSEPSTTISFRLETDLVERIDANMPVIDARSRNDFVSKAIKFYNVYLQLDGEPDIFTKIVATLVEQKIKLEMLRLECKWESDVERLARNQFKVAVELSKLSRLFADQLEIEVDKLEQRHFEVVHEVRTINGILGFDDRFAEEV